jgi:hypothetical protein
MRKLIASTFVSLDGVMQAPGGPEEDPTGGFAFGGWTFNYWDEVMGRAMNGFDGKDHLPRRVRARQAAVRSRRKGRRAAARRFASFDHRCRDEHIHACR